MNTRKFPRTLEEAFGPYQRQGLVEHYDPMPKADRIVVGISLAAVAALVALSFAGLIR